MSMQRTHRKICQLSVRQFGSEGKQNKPEANSCLYKTLGVKEDANTIEVREAYLQKAREFHPDRRPDCLEYFTHVTRAYEVLSDPQKRAIYDEEQVSDEDYFKVKIGPVKVNLLGVMMSTSLVAIGYYGYLKLNGKNDEDKCPVNHK